MPLREVRFLRQKPNGIEFLSEEDIAPEGDAEDAQGDQDDDDLHRGDHDHLGYGLEDGLEDVFLREFVGFEVLMLKARQGSIPLLFDSPLVDAEPSHEPSGLEHVDHDQAHGAEYTEGPEAHSVVPIWSFANHLPLP